MKILEMTELQNLNGGKRYLLPHEQDFINGFRDMLRILSRR